jgi:hypothetical protein
VTAPQFDVLRPSPLDLGGVIGGSFKIFKQRLGQFAVLAVIPTAIMLVLLVAAAVPLILGIVVSARELRFSGLVVLGVLLMFAAILVGYLAQIKVQAMITLGSHDVIHHRPSSIGELSRRTAGVVARVLLLVLLALTAIFAVYGLIIGVTVMVILGGVAVASSNSVDPSAAIGTAVLAYLIAVLLMIGLGLLVYYLVVRFLYFLPALAVENLRAVDALKRSWRLTKGNFLRTLGYIIVASLLVSLASTAVSLIGQLLTLPGTAQSSSSNADPAVVLFAVLPGLIATLVLSCAVQVLALPFLTSYITVMYVDQLRRNSLPPGYRPGAFPPPPGARHPQQSYGAPPPQQSGAPGQWQPVNPPQPNGGHWGQHPPQQWGQP